VRGTQQAAPAWLTTVLGVLILVHDADSMVAAFAGRLQDAVDLDAVRDDLAGLVQQALEPGHVSVWLSERS